MEIRELLDNADVCGKKAPLKPLAKSLRALCSVCDDPEQVVKETPDLEDYSDLIVKSEENEYHVHKAILSARLPKIQKSIQRAEKRAERIDGKPFISFSPDFMKKDILEYVLIYTYSEKIDIEMKIVEIFDKVMKRFGCHEVNALIKKELRSISYYFKALAKGTAPKRFVLYPPVYPQAMTLEESMQQLRLISNAQLRSNAHEHHNIDHHVDILLKLSTTSLSLNNDDTQYSFIRAHKCILCARSEYFRKLTSSYLFEQYRMKSSNDSSNDDDDTSFLPVYHLPNLSYESTMLVMEYIYTNGISMTDKIRDIEFISNVFDAAEFLLVFEVKKIFGELILKELQCMLKDNLNMLCQLLWISDIYQVVVLRDYCLSQMAILFNKIALNGANEFEIELFEKFILSAAPKTFTDADSLFESEMIRNCYNNGKYVENKVAGIGMGSILQDLREQYLEIFSEDTEVREDYAQEFDRIFYDFTIKAKKKWTSSS